jgi:hypothetical protein
MSRVSRYSILIDDPMQFSTMKPWIYYSGTTFIYLLCVVGGLFINDLGIVFNLISAFVLSFLSFIWPASFYLVAEYYHTDPKGREDRRLNIIHAWI